MKALRYRFDDYLLDAAARELWRGGERVAIPPKSLECLAYLLQYRDRAVGRDELIAAVWGRVDASDTLLTQTIWRARRAIGDEGDRSLRTVPRFGYRWVAPVRVEEGPGDHDASSAPVPPVEPTLPARSSARTRMGIAALVLVAALATTLFFATRDRHGAGQAAIVPSLVVVLPVNVADASADATWIRLGAMDYVASRLRDARLNVLPS